MLRLPTENTLDREEKIMAEQFTTLASLTVDGKGSYGIGASAVPFSKDLYTYLRITDIKDDGTLNLQDLKSVDDEKASEYLLKPNDIVFARTGASTGRNYFYDGMDGEFVYAGFLIKFSIDEKKVNPKYIKYFCQSKQYKDWINSFNTGSTRGNINAQTLGKMPIPLIERTAQDALVSILSSIDEKIKKNNEINNNLEQQAQAIFDNMFPNISIGESTIGDTITPKRGKSLLSKNAVIGNVPVVAGGLEPSTYHNVANTIAPVLAISASGANAGYVSLWNIPIWSSDSSFIDSSMTDDVYFWYVLLKKRQKEIYDSQTGSAQPHIYPQHIASMPISKLNVEEVRNYTSIVTPIFEKIGHNKEENMKLAQIRDTLLPKLMSGELDVSDIDL